MIKVLLLCKTIGPPYSRLLLLQWCGRIFYEAPGKERARCVNHLGKRKYTCFSRECRNPNLDPRQTLLRTQTRRKQKKAREVIMGNEEAWSLSSTGLFASPCPFIHHKDRSTHLGTAEETHPESAIGGSLKTCCSRGRSFSTRTRGGKYKVQLSTKCYASFRYTCAMPLPYNESHNWNWTKIICWEFGKTVILFMIWLNYKPRPPYEWRTCWTHWFRGFGSAD